MCPSHMCDICAMQWNVGVLCVYIWCINVYGKCNSSNNIIIIGCTIKIYIHYKIYTDEMINKMSGQLFSSQQSYQRQPAAFMCTRTQNTQLCGTTAAVVTPQYVYFRIFYYIFFAHSVFVLCCMHSRTCVFVHIGGTLIVKIICVWFLPTEDKYTHRRRVYPFS